jgi:hypothetical protein
MVDIRGTHVFGPVVRRAVNLKAGNQFCSAVEVLLVRGTLASPRRERGTFIGLSQIIRRWSLP